MKERKTMDLVLGSHTSPTGNRWLKVRKNCSICNQPRGLAYDMLVVTRQGKAVTIDQLNNGCGHKETEQLLINEGESLLLDSKHRLDQLYKLLKATKVYSPFEYSDGVLEFDEVVKRRRDELCRWFRENPKFDQCDAVYFKIRGLMWSTHFDKDFNEYDMNKHDKALHVAYAALSGAYLTLAAERQKHSELEKHCA